MSDPSLEQTTRPAQITRVCADVCTPDHDSDPIGLGTLYVKGMQSHGLIEGGDAGCASQPEQMTPERCAQVQRLATGVVVGAERGDRGEEDRVNTGGPLPPPIGDQGVAHVWAGRFGIAAAMTGCVWHAVDLQLLGAQPAAAHGQPRRPVGVEVLSVCGARANMVGTLRPFSYGSRRLGRWRCERCSWVVAPSRGTVEQEIDLHTADGGADTRGDLLRQVVIAILADAPTGLEAEAGVRSDLLAHAAGHRPVMTVCERFPAQGAAAAHGPTVAHCPQAAQLCQECSLSAGSWAGERQGATTDECVVVAPCSVLALAAHDGIPAAGRERQR